MTTKKQNIAVIAVFLCMVFGMTIWTMVTPSREFSERENRALAQMPEASVESCFSGKFEKDFETYLTDQFPMRDGWISAKTAIEKATFKTESKDIYFADDDYLIEAHSKSFTAPSANANIGYLKNFMETCVETYGKDHATAMVVPNAVDILRDHLPKYASPYDEEVYLQKVADAMPEGTWFDSGSVLREHKNIQLYYRTDHHWTTEAAYYVYAAWAEEKGLSPLALSDYKKKTLTDGFFGTVDAKVGGRNEMQQAEEPYPANQEPVNTGMPNPQNPQNMGNPQNMQGRGQQYANNGYQNPQNYAGGYYQPEEPQEPEVNPKLEKFMTIGSIVVGVLILAIFLALVGSATGLFDLGFLAGGSNKKQTETTTATETTQISGQVEVPSILGKTEAEAKEMLADTGLGLEYAGEEPSTDYDKGQIMAQQPAKGEMVDKNTTISYTVSTGSDKITLPDLENESADDAKAALEKLGLKCDQQEVYDISIAQGHVSYTSPGAGQEVAPNSTVTLYISNGGDGSVDSSDPASDTETDTETQETVKETKKETESKETSAKAEYSTDVKLYAPQDYNDEKVRIELVQDGKTTTLVDGEVVEFPYSLKMTSDSGSSATAYVYVLDDDGNILKKVEYEGVPFSK